MSISEASTGADIPLDIDVTPLKRHPENNQKLTVDICEHAYRAPKVEKISDYPHTLLSELQIQKERFKQFVEDDAQLRLIKSGVGNSFAARKHRKELAITKEQACAAQKQHQHLVQVTFGLLYRRDDLLNAGFDNTDVEDEEVGMRIHVKHILSPKTHEDEN